jgi:hypothetical protein
VISAYKIQNNAIESLKAEFEDAAFDAKGRIFAAVDMALSLDDAEKARDVAGFKYPSSSYNLAYARDKMQFLLQGAKGKYVAKDDYLSVYNAHKLWGDYLKEIGRHANGFGSVPTNEDRIEALIAQNGAKKMEKRLTSFLKKRIAAELDVADYGIAPKRLEI